VVSKGFFSSKGNPKSWKEREHLAALAARGKAGDTVGGGVRDTVDTLGAAGHLLGGLLAGGLGTTLDVVVNDRLGGRVGSVVLDLVVVLGEASVAGIDESLKTLTLAGVGLHQLLVLLESGVHLAGLNIVEEDTRAERAGNSSTELAITGLRNHC
jgi:hypothetical protein